MTNFFKSLEQKKDVPVAGTKLVKVPQKIKVTHSQKIPNSKHQLVGIGQDSGALWQSKTPFLPSDGCKDDEGYEKEQNGSNVVYMLDNYSKTFDKLDEISGRKLGHHRLNDQQVITYIHVTRHQAHTAHTPRTHHAHTTPTPRTPHPVHTTHSTHTMHTHHAHTHTTHTMHTHHAHTHTRTHHAHHTQTTRSTPHTHRTAGTTKRPNTSET